MNAMKASVLSLFALCAWPSVIGNPSFIQLPQLLVISVERSHPPHIAHEELERVRFFDDWDEMSRRPGLRLSTTEEVEIKIESGRTVVELAPMVIDAPNEYRVAGRTPAADDELVEITGLDPRQRNRLEQAVQKHGTLASADPATSWFEEAQRIVDGANKEPAKDRVIVQAVAGAGQQPAERSRSEVRIDPTQDLEISGFFRISEGLHYTNEQTFEIWRRQEGVYTDQGTVEAVKGRYRIGFRGKTGEIVARMRDAKGRVIGEQTYSLARIKADRGTVTGPDIQLLPRVDVAAHLFDSYAQKSGQALSDASVSVFEGAVAMKASEPGHLELNDVAPGSWTTLRTSANGFVPTLALRHSGEVHSIPLMPTEMISSMKEIVSEALNLNLTSPLAPVIWGRVMFEKKPIAGVTVEVESSPGSVVVYFNELMLPDFSLKATSTNGTYAVIGMPSGFHALIARRGEGYFAHQNAVVEERSVTIVDLESRLATESVPVRSFDAFTGGPVAARILHQAVEEPFEIGSQGSSWIQIPTIRRLSLIHVQPDSPYLPAAYQADDSRGYVHLPLVRGDWMSALLTSVRADDIPETSIVVGFVPEEGFEVEAADPSGRARVIYFDSRGYPSAEGTTGGGFVIQGLPEGVREIMVFGKSSGAISSRVIAADPRSIQILTFRAE